MPLGYQMLGVYRVNQVMQQIQDVRDLPAELLFLGRTPLVDAVDNEIMARFLGRIQIADIIADDQQAAVDNWGKINYETTAIPNIKVGSNMTQAMLNQLQSIDASGADPSGLFAGWEARLMDSLLTGVRQRIEALLVAMHLDSFNYNRLGIQSAGSWGMPADLKVTTAVGWDQAATATPVSDILSLKRVAQTRYGIVYDRAIMSQAAMSYMVATTDWQNHARFVLPPGVPTSALPLQNTDYVKQLSLGILGLKEIDLYDYRYWSQNEAGVASSAPYLPITNVILDAMANDNNGNVKDFANGVVTESIVSSLMPSQMIGRFTAPVRGPIAYATAPDDLNPPNVQYWSVARGFPRRHLLQMNGVLTVGTFTDPIPPTEPFLLDVEEAEAEPQAAETTAAETDTAASPAQAGARPASASHEERRPGR